MWFPIGILLRWLIVGIAALLVLAVMVGRMDARNPGHQLSSWNRRHLTLEWPAPPSESGQPLRLKFVEIGENQLWTMILPDGIRLAHARVAPWCDDLGRSQVVGLRIERTPDGSEQVHGLARLQFPNGQLLDSVKTDLAPISPPCWLPGASSRILYLANDGRLYRHNFDTQTDPLVGNPTSSQPIPLEWIAPLPHRGDARLVDLSLPETGAWDGYALVSVARPESRPHRFDDRDADVMPSEIWWLKLEADSAIVGAAGLLLRSSNRVAYRQPVLALDAQGYPTLLVLRRPIDAPNGPSPNAWELCQIPAPVDPQSIRDRPLSDRNALVLTDDAALGPPVASSDGRWVAVRRSIRDYTPRMARVPIPPRNPERRADDVLLVKSTPRDDQEH